MPNVAKAMSGKHKPVLLQETTDGLDLEAHETFVDGTYGAGGHSKEVRRRYGDKVKIITIDQDPAAHADITGNFRDIDKLLGDVRPDAILLDLGFSSDQLTSVPGLSFQRDELLDMRLSREGTTAAMILNSFDEQAIELILRGFGEEKYSRKVARAIVERRPLNTTFDLVRAVESVVRKTGKINPATKTFQALRIAVNEELDTLERGLLKAFDKLRPSGRLAVISFHSLEDRIVKNFYRNQATLGNAKIITKKPITPSQDEILENPRSRSAKLRILEKTK